MIGLKGHAHGTVSGALTSEDIFQQLQKENESDGTGTRITVGFLFAHNHTNHVRHQIASHEMLDQLAIR